MLFHCVRITTVINVFPKNVSLLKTIWFGADRQYHRSKLIRVGMIFKKF